MLAAQIEPTSGHPGMAQSLGIGLVDMPDPILPAGGGLIRLEGCGLCGSDLDKLMNQKAKPGTVLGHEVVGVMEALDPEAQRMLSAAGKHLAVGDRVVAAHHVPCGTCHYCLNDSQSMCRHFKETNLVPGGFAQKIALSGEHLLHTCFPIPDHVTDAEASCMEPLACVIRAAERSMSRGGVFRNGTVIVTGLGFIGLMASQLYSNMGYQVYGLDLDPDRLHLAQRERFVDHAFDAQTQQEELQERMKKETPLGKADLVFLSVVNQHTLANALDFVRDGGTLVLFTSPNHPEVRLDPNLLYFREINVIPSYSPSLESLRQAADMIFQRKISVQPLITHTVPLRELSHGIALYQSGQAIKVFVQLQEGTSE